MHIFLFNLKKAIENLKFNFLTIICEIRKNVTIQSCSFQKDLQIFATQFLIKHIFFVSIRKNTFKIQKFNFLDKICEIQKKRLDGKLFA